MADKQTAFHLWRNQSQIPPVTIYTDGSKTENGAVYAFCVFKYYQLILTNKLNFQNENSVYHSEL